MADPVRELKTPNGTRGRELTSLSGKFKELKDKAAAWVSGKPAPTAV